MQFFFLTNRWRTAADVSSPSFVNMNVRLNSIFLKVKVANKNFQVLLYVHVHKYMDS